MLVEFVDLQCPFCRRFHLQTFDEIRNRYIKTGKVRYVVKDLPLPIHPQAMAAAVATRCAGIVGKDEGYWKMFEALFANGAMLSEAVIVSLSDDLGFDRKAFSECRSDRNVAQLIENDAAEATKLGITGTPTVRYRASGIEGGHRRAHHRGAAPCGFYDACRRASERFEITSRKGFTFREDCMREATPWRRVATCLEYNLPL